jgi:hypothetical protein
LISIIFYLKNAEVKEERMLRWISAVLIVVNFLLSTSVLATETEEFPKIAYSSKFRSLDYFFTDTAEKQAVVDGANYDVAIREVGWDLISAVGRACHSVSNIQAIYIDRINFKGRYSFIVRGVLADLKFQTLKFDGSLSNKTLQDLAAAFKKENISITESRGATGVELMFAGR